MNWLITRKAVNMYVQNVNEDENSIVVGACGSRNIYKISSKTFVSSTNPYLLTKCNELIVASTDE
jgi:hypothetical protein